MSQRNLYLHEFIDIVGEGAMRYMAHTAGFDVEAAADRGLELVGTWYTMGSTGRWPQVVNLWESVDGWSGWRRLMEATNLRRTQNPELVEWWQEALKTRTGGFDRLLGAAPGCPSLADLRANGVSGSVFVHELSEVRPGAALDYLAAVRESRLPLLAEYRHELVGLYEVLMTDVEEGGDERIAQWHKQARAAGRTRWREELMTPYPDTLLSRGDSL
jgi:hypothetical protein